MDTRVKPAYDTVYVGRALRFSVFTFQTAQTTLISQRFRVRGVSIRCRPPVRGRAERRVPDAPLACALDAVFGK